MAFVLTTLSLIQKCSQRLCRKWMGFSGAWGRRWGWCWWKCIEHWLFRIGGTWRYFSNFECRRTGASFEQIRKGSYASYRCGCTEKKIRSVHLQKFYKKWQEVPSSHKKYSILYLPRLRKGAHSFFFGYKISHLLYQLYAEIPFHVNTYASFG